MLNNRWVTRISLVLVLLMGIIGGWYTANNWSPDFSSYDVSTVTEDTDWIDLIANLSEETVQLILGLTSGEQ